jgi:hypothetical protein
VKIKIICRYHNFVFFQSLMNFAVIAVLFLAVESRPVTEHTKLNCFIKHLKSMGNLNADYPEFVVTESPGAQANCTEIVEETRQNFYDQEAKSTYEICLINELKSRNAQDEAMKSVVFLSSDVLTKEEIARKIEDLLENMKILSYESMNVCDSGAELVKTMVDSVFNKKSDSSEKSESDLKFDYCRRKYVLDKNLIDTNQHNITLNPKNLDVSEVNCEEVIKIEISKSMAGKHKFFGCMTKKIESPNNVDTEFKIFVLLELGMTEEQEKVERKS